MKGIWEFILHTWGHLDEGIKNLHFSHLRDPFVLCKSSCTGLNDMSLQHFNFIQSLLIDLPNLEGRPKYAQKYAETAELYSSSASPLHSPNIRASCRAQKSCYRTMKAIWSNITDVKTGTHRGKWLKTFIVKSGTEPSLKLPLLPSQLPPKL